MSKSFVEFSLVTGCPNDCKFCPQEAHLKAYTGVKMLSMDNYIKMVDKLPKSTISIAGFSEPFVNQSCTDMIEYATKKGNTVIIYSTLQGMTIEQYNRLRKNYSVRSLMIHLPDKEGNTKVKMDDGYKQLLKYITQNPPGAWCSVDYSVHGSAVHSEIIDIVNINPIYRIHDRAGNLETNDSTVHRVHWESGSIVCANGFGHPESGIVMPNGDTYLCCMDWKLEHKLGNLLEQSWSELMGSDARKQAKLSRETGLEGICRHCAEAQMDYRG